MKSYLKRGYSGFLVTAGVVSFGIALLYSGVAQAAPQYTLTCDYCHRMPPLDSATGTREPATGAFKGNHQTHAGTTAASCAKCHGNGVVTYPTGHRDKTIQVQGNINSSPATGTYSRVFFNQTSVPPATLGSCSNVNCHFETTSPEWGTAPLASPDLTTCATCHDSLPATYAHTKHLQTFGNDLTVCAKCHPDHAGEAKPFQHATSAGHAGRNITLTIGSYAGSNFSFLPSQSGSRTVGSCSNIYCHSPGQNATGGPLGAGDYATPDWGDPATGACGTCHATTTSTTGSHAKHISAGADCGNCHAGATATSYVSSNHANGQIDVGQGGYDKGGAPGNGYGSCSSATCHVSPYGSASVQSPVWGTAAGCAACHSGAGAFTANGAPATGSHSAHMSLAGSACNLCHNGAVSGTSGGATHTNGTVEVANGYSASPVTKHAPGTYTGTCSTASCHASPYGTGTVATPVWGTAAGCSACHNGIGAFAANGAPATGSHSAHMSLTGAACNQCHTGAVSGISGGANHTNGTVDVANDYTGSPVVKHAPGTYTGTCLTASCHSDPYSSGFAVSPVWGTPVGCAACHNGAGAFTATGAPATGSHDKHMAVNGAACSLCHPGAVSGVSGGATHANGTVEVVNGYTASPVTKHPIGTYGGTCTTASCHSDGNGTPVATPVWGIVQAATCTTCHGGAAMVTPAMATGKHHSHMNNYSTLGLGNNLMCAECHAKTVSLASNTVITNPINHLNNFKDYSGAKAGGNYDTASGVCANVYCHSSGQAAPVYRTMTGSRAWRSTAKLDCNGCHGNEPGAAWSSGFGAPNYANHSTAGRANSHKKHTVDAGMTDTRGCAKCHRTTVDMGTANKLRDYSSAHLNKTRDVAFAIYGRYSTTTQTCTTYCHSNVQAPGGNGPATVYASPVWGAQNGTMTCASCHSNMSALTEAPENLLLGSHKRHAVDAGYSCSVCHGAGYSPTSTGPTHADGTINLSFTGRASTTTYSQQVNNTPGDGYGTCSTSACHGRATRNWGSNTTDPACEKCHGSANTAQASGTFKDTAGSPASPYVGTHVSHLAGTHNYSNPIACTECHTVPGSVNSFGHMSSLPARLNWGALATSTSRIPGGTGAAMTPAYSGSPAGACTNTYCHAGVRASDGTPSGSNPAPVWGDPAYLGGTGCGKCHSYPPAYPHPNSQVCSACHNHVDQSNLGFADKSKHINGTVEVTVDNCLGCHSSVNACQESDPTCINKKLIGAHEYHTDAELFLRNGDGSYKSLSAGDFIDTSWIYGIKYEKGFPRFACGFCHPMDSGKHKNGVVDLDLDPSHSLAGTVKTKNLAGGPWLISYTSGTNVVCSNVYCHSNGYISETTNQYTFQQTPNWYATNPWAGVDKCNQCHGNSPNSGGKEGSPAHGRHVVASHYKDVFDGYSSKLAFAGPPGSGAVHGDPANATTFNCNICHNATVKMSNNDLGSACVGCHSAIGTAPLKGTMDVYSSNNTHINGSVDVVFMDPFNVKTRAQLRNNITSVQSVYTSWTRTSGYKTYSSHDLARTKPTYVGGTCSTVACHNGTQMEWRTKGPLDCSACHTGLPQ